MPRLKKEVVEQREQFIRDFFKQNPAGSVDDAQKAIKESTKMMMNPARIDALRLEVLSKSGEKTPEQPQEVAAEKAKPDFVTKEMIAEAFESPQATVSVKRTEPDPDFDAPIKVKQIGRITVIDAPAELSNASAFQKYENGDYEQE